MSDVAFPLYCEGRENKWLTTSQHDLPQVHEGSDEQMQADFRWRVKP